MCGGCIRVLAADCSELVTEVILYEAAECLLALTVTGKINKPPLLVRSRPFHRLFSSAANHKYQTELVKGHLFQL